MSKKVKIYICTEGKKCPKKGSKDVARALKKAVDTQDPDGQSIVVKECKCLDLCKKGPAIVVMPDKVRYGRVEPEDAGAIVSAHLNGDDPVSRLVIKKKD